MSNLFQNRRRELLIWSLLALILLVAAGFRLQRLDWDDGQYFHPDERAIIYDYGSLGGVMNLNTVPVSGAFRADKKPVNFPPGGLSFFIPNDATNLRPATETETKAYLDAKSRGIAINLPANVVLPDQPVPEKAINFWNAAFSPLNPRFFAYGSMPMYLIKFSGWVAAGVGGPEWNSYEKLMLVGRFMSVLFSLGTVALAFFLGRRVFGPSLGREKGEAIGLLAAAFLAITVLDIQLAHFLTFDVALTFFVTLTIFVAVGHMRSGTRWSALRMGLAFGLALSCKVSAIPLGLVIVAAALLYGLYGKASGSGENANKPALKSWPEEQERYGEVGLGPRLFSRTFVNLIIAGAATLVMWFVAMPYAFLDFTTWFDRVLAENGMARGIADYPYTRQYVGTIPFLYQFGNWIQWGLSIPLGLLAVTGLGYGLYRSVRFRLKAEILLYCWILPYMLITFTGEAKFNRYLLPLTPVALVLAARLMASLFSYKMVEGQIFFRRFLQVARYTLLVLVLGWALVWAISFSAIYGKEHSRVTASKWIYENITPGAKLSAEAWDESLPVSLPSKGEFREQFQYVSWNSYEDRPNEDMALVWAEKLRDTDYIVLSSNRLYATIPKLPWRYPITTHLYEMLFKGDLGFELVQTVTSYPTVPMLGWEINSDSADESFSVYDHPKVYIFKKKEQLTDAEWRGMFGPAINSPWVAKRYPVKGDLPVFDAKAMEGILESTGLAQREEKGKSLLLDKPVDRQPAIDDNGWNKIANEQQWLGVILWFLMAQALGLIGLPIALRVFRRLPDRGYILAKPIGAALVALVIFLVVGTRLYMNTVATAYMCLLLVAAFSGWLWWHYRDDILNFYRHNRALVLLEEGVFLFGFLLFVFIRLGNPDLWHPFFGGEKPMEFAHLNAIVRSAYFPPFDPWFSDGYLNYYYYGQYLVSTWVKLTGIHTGIAFNLAIPLLYAFVLTGGYSLSYNLARMYQRWRARRSVYLGGGAESLAKGSYFAEHQEAASQHTDSLELSKAGPMWAGLFGAFTLAVAANIDGLIQLFQHNESFADLANRTGIYPVEAEKLNTFDYFRSTRVIPDTINEFPYFSFLYADLHAHLIALPFTLLLLALALNLLAVNWAGYNDSRNPMFLRPLLRLWHAMDRTLLIPVVFAVVIGLIGATNAWDLPTYLLVIFMSLFLAFFRRPPYPVESEEEAEHLSPRFRPLTLLLEIVIAGAVTGFIALSAFGLYNNFFGKYQALYSEVKLTNLYTDFGQLIFFWMMPLFFTSTFMIWSYLRWLNYRRSHPFQAGLENNGNGQEFEEEELDEPVAPQRANYSTRPLQRPEIAFALAGGGSGGSTPGIGGSGGNFTPRRASKINGFSLPWLVLLGGAALIMIVGWVLPVTMECKYTSVFCQTSGPGLTHTGNRWASFSTMFFMAVGFLFLIFGRAYDPDPAQSAEARNPAGLFVKLMVLAAFCIIAGLEVIYLADDFANSYRERANSIFKFYYQAWTMLALASAFIAYVLWTNWIAPRWSDAQRQGGLFRNALRFGWIGIASLLAISCSLYAFLVTPARISERMSTPLPAPTLDGRAYFDTLRRVTGMPNMPLGKSFDMFYEAKSMREFYDNIKGTPVVLQSSIWPYRGGGSWIAVNTGLPIVLGYDHHSSQQHYDFQVWKRSNNGGGGGDIHEMYDTADIENAISLINRYHITYIHLGVIEREADVFRPCNPGEPGDTSRSRTPLCYEPMVSESGFAKFDKMVSLGLLEIAYQNPGVTVLKVTARGRSGVIDPVAAAQNPTTVISTDPKLARLLDQVKREPDNFQARYDLGTYYFKRGEMAKAAEQFEAVVKLVPNEVNPWHVLGDIYAALGDNQKALAAWKEPTVRAPNIPAGHNKYALGLVAVGRLEEAINEFNLTIKLNPKYVEASYHLGDLYEKQGKKPEAITAYTYVIQNSSAPTDFWASRASERLRALGRT